jgi:hypothetical protein
MGAPKDSDFRNEFAIPVSRFEDDKEDNEFERDPELESEPEHKIDGKKSRMNALAINHVFDSYRNALNVNQTERNEYDDIEEIKSDYKSKLGSSHNDNNTNTGIISDTDRAAIVQKLNQKRRKKRKPKANNNLLDVDDNVSQGARSTVTTHIKPPQPKENSGDLEGTSNASSKIDKRKLKSKKKKRTKNAFVESDDKQELEDLEGGEDDIFTSQGMDSTTGKINPDDFMGGLIPKKKKKKIMKKKMRKKNKPSEAIFDSISQVSYYDNEGK